MNNLSRVNPFAMMGKKYEIKCPYCGKLMDAQLSALMIIGKQDVAKTECAYCEKQFETQYDRKSDELKVKNLVIQNEDKKAITKAFDYMEFNNDSMVFRQEKYTKQQALEIAKEENEEFNDRLIDDVKEEFVAYRFDPYYCQPEFGSNGAYMIVPKGARGSFPVWVIS